QNAIPDFGYDYARELGLALIDDPARWQRGAEYLRIAARGLPKQGPTLFLKLAQAYEKAGDAEMARTYRNQAKRARLEIGVQSLSGDERSAYFTAVHNLAEDADRRNDLDAAIENYRFYTESERSGMETYRRLADVYERKGDMLAALKSTEQALQYMGSSK